MGWKILYVVATVGALFLFALLLGKIIKWGSSDNDCSSE